MKGIEARNYIDESTNKYFRFVFRCEVCGKIVLDYTVKNDNYFKPKFLKFSKKQTENEKLWIKEHSKALDKAKELALEKLNRCEICGRLICDECAFESSNLNGGICCKNCNNN